MREADGGENREYGSLRRLPLRFDFDPGCAHLLQLSISTIRAEGSRNKFIRSPPGAMIMHDVDDENLFRVVVAGQRLNRLPDPFGCSRNEPATARRSFPE